MNPGPFGMAQNGIPFGDTAMVRSWLGIEAPVERPRREHPKRPVMGFGMTRGEVSGARLWGWARERFRTPERFFRRAFVWNYCPLSFMNESGRNVTPDKLPRAERDPLFAACDDALAAVIARLRPAKVVGVGAFAAAAGRPARAGRRGRVPGPPPIQAPRAPPPTAGGRRYSRPPSRTSASISTRPPVEPPRSPGRRGRGAASVPDRKVQSSKERGGAGS